MSMDWSLQIPTRAPIIAPKSILNIWTEWIRVLRVGCYKLSTFQCLITSLKSRVVSLLQVTNESKCTFHSSWKCVWKYDADKIGISKDSPNVFFMLRIPLWGITKPKIIIFPQIDNGISTPEQSERIDSCACMYLNAQVNSSDLLKKNSLSAPQDLNAASFWTTIDQRRKNICNISRLSLGFSKARGTNRASFSLTYFKLPFDCLVSDMKRQRRRKTIALQFTTI